MLEQMISSPITSIGPQTGRLERQALPTLSGFSEILKAALPESFSRPLASAEELNVLAADSEAIDFEMGLDSTVQVDSLGNNSFSEAESELFDAVNMPLSEGLELNKSNVILVSPSSTQSPSEPRTDFSADVATEVATLDEHAEEVESSVLLGTTGNEQDLLDVSIDSTLEAKELSPRIIGSDSLDDDSEGLLNDEIIEDEALILATGVIEPDAVADKGAITGVAKSLADQSGEGRHENKGLKLSSAAEPFSQNATVQKGTSSEDPGQQSRGQSMQQQFMNMAQSTSQNTNVIREQQVERQFSALLNERVATQTLTQGEAEATKLSNPAIAAERRAQLPVGLQSIGLPVTHEKWGQALGQRVVYMANQQVQQAQITLNPDKLGPVQVRLQIDRDQKVSVLMVAQHGVTREALEAALPRLREMLEQSGIEVSSVDINDKKQFEEREREEAKKQQASSTSTGDGDSAGETLTESAPGVTTYSTDNVVDYYA